MSRENVEVVRRSLAAWNRGDLEGALRDFDPRVEVDWSESLGPQRGVYSGIEKSRQFLEEWLALFDEVEIRPEEFIDTGDHVLVPNCGYALGRDGVRVEARSTQVFTLRGGKIVRLRLYQEKQAALDAVG
jgi:uncharacterized protein